jgi:signal transduction histidine kinase
MKVLVVDGSKRDRRLVVEALLDLTNIVVYGAVPDLRGALSAIEHELPDVIVTDTQLPDGCGCDLIEAARRHQPMPSIAVFTENDSEEQRRRCHEAGADLYIHKHAGLRELQLGIRDLVLSRNVTRRDRSADPFRLLGRMTAGIAHDLNNYLTVLAVSLDLLERREADPALWSRARHAMDAATTMTRNLLAYARGGSPEPERVDLAALARRTVGLVASAVPIGILISLDVDDEPPPVLGVASELEQVVLNLILNACDAMPRGGELRVGVRADVGGGVRLEVSDTGGGVADEVNFAVGTVTPSTKVGRQGGGLGLGIVRSVVERHRASLRLAPRLSGGTVVTVVFPGADPA